MASPKTSSGLDQNLAAALAYLLGPVSSVVLLLIEPHNRYIRFHAFQSAFFVVAVGILFFALMGLGVLGWVLWVPCFVAVTVLWAFLMFKALNGVQYKLPLLGDWAEAQVK